MDFSGLKDLKTTIPGAFILIAMTLALFKGVCTYDQWWKSVLIILGFIGGTGLLFTGKQVK